MKPWPFLIGIALILRWAGALRAGYSSEDSWYFDKKFYSIQDVFLWIFQIRDSLGYYRPVRRILFAIPNLFFAIPPPEIYHAAVLILFFIALFVLWKIYRRLGLSEASSFLAVFCVGISPVFEKSLFWISGSHNILAFLFFLLSLHSLLIGKRGWLLLFWCLALGSRETVLGLLPALLWVDFLQNPRFEWRQMLQRNWPLLTVSLIFIAIFLGGQIPHTEGAHAKNLLGQNAIWHGPGYLLLFFWPKWDNRPLLPGTAPMFVFYLSGILFLALVWKFKDFLMKKSNQAIWFFLFFGGMIVHLVHVEHWNPEYMSISAAGFFGIIFSVADRKKRTRWAVGLPIVIIGILLVYPSWQNSERTFTAPWRLTEEWLAGLDRFCKGLDPEDVVVIEATETFQSNFRTYQLVFFDQYLKVKFPGRMVLWNTKLIPIVAQSPWLGARALEYAYPNQRFQGNNLVFVRERNLAWEILRKERIP